MAVDKKKSEQQSALEPNERPGTNYAECETMVRERERERERRREFSQFFITFN
jgi:hypothetical protein